MKEFELGEAMRAAVPEPSVSDQARLQDVRAQLGPGRTNRVRLWAGAVATAAALAAAALVPILINGGESKAPAPPAVSSTALQELPDGTLKCVIEGSYFPADLGKVTPGALGVRMCTIDSHGFVPGDTVQGDLSSLIDSINALPDFVHHFSTCPLDDSSESYWLVFGYTDGHTEVVNGTTGGLCDLVNVNQVDKRGATPVLEAFRNLVG